MENIFVIRTKKYDNSPLSLKPTGYVEHIKISSEGFWYKGEKVEQGEGEAQRVYDAWCSFLAETNHL